MVESFFSVRFQVVVEFILLTQLALKVVLAPFNTFHRLGGIVYGNALIHFGRIITHDAFLMFGWLYWDNTLRRYG